MKRLLTTEKPSVAKDFAKALGARFIKRGESGYYESDDYLIAYCFGHMTRLKEPGEYRPEWQKWEARLLAPESFEKVSVEDKAAQIDLLTELIGREDVSALINAGDAGREGEGIQRDLYAVVFERLGITKPVLRFWTSDVLSKSVICEGLEALQPSKLYDGLYEAYLGRERADWLVGFNATRAFTSLFAKGSKPLSIGRVQSAVLALIVRREKMIESFVARAFWGVNASGEGVMAKAIGPQSSEGDRYTFWDEKDVDALISRCEGKPFSVISSEKKERKEYPPKLFSMPLLQQQCDTLFGWSAERTLELAQRLYEKRFTTYPRTDSAYLGDAQKDDRLIKIRSEAVSGLIDLQGRMAEMLPVEKTANRIFNEKKLTDHHAIIPALLDDTACSYEQLEADEKRLFEVIALRFIDAFLPPAVYEESEAVLACEGDAFIAKASLCKASGWRAFGEKPLKGSTLELEPGEELMLKLEKKSSTTTPPSRFSVGEMIGAMTNAHRYLEGERDAALKEVLKNARGIGTAATRDKFIPLLENRGYIEVKNNILRPLARGVELINMLNGQDVIDFAYTAKMELELQRLENGESHLGLAGFESQAKEQAKNLILHAKEASKSGQKAAPVLAEVRVPENAKVVGKCPECGGTVVVGAQNYYCLNRKNGCGFVIWHNSLAMLGHKNVTAGEIKKLLLKATPLKLKKTDGRVYEGMGRLEKQDAKWRIKIDFDAGLKAQAYGRCPLCGEEVIESPAGFGCSAWKTGCGFTIYKDALRRFGGKKLSKADAKKLLKEGELLVDLKRKNGREYQKYAVLDENFGIRIDFDRNVAF